MVDSSSSMNCMNDLIPVVNKLQDAFASLGMEPPFELPQIAVVGAQSAGKSSVLENCVGRDFLPRGNGIVTRRPLILQLIQYQGQEYGQFLHCPNKKFTDFNQIRTEIEAETDRTTGKNKGISPQPISLKIFSPNVLNLTLVDLPGLTKVPVGDQPKDIERQIRNMILHFIEQQNCLILAVSPANSDLANSDAIKLAKSVDPQGMRTIGVLTKLDLMDQGTDARDILDNKVIPLRRGYIGVVNRSQKDIDGRKDINAAQEAERQFFVRHAAYRQISERMGTKFLAQSLSNQLTNHIRECLPTLRRTLTKQLSEMEKDVGDIKKMSTDNSGTTKTKVIVQLINQFSEDFLQKVEGGQGDVSFTELSGGARINRLFVERFPYELVKHDYDEEQIRKEIAIVIRNAQGVRTGLFTPDQAFDMMVRKMIENLKTPCLACVESAQNELMDILGECGSSIKKYPDLRQHIESLVGNYVREDYQRCQEQVTLLINCQLSYMNTSHPDFIGFDQAQSDSENKKGRVNVGNQVIRKGWLSTASGAFGSSKEFWFVLTADTLTWYRDDEEKEQKHMITLQDCIVKDAPKKMMGKKYSFELTNTKKKFIYKDNSSLIINCNSEDELDSWKASLLRAGVFPDRKKNDEENTESSNRSSTDPTLERQVETIRNLVDSYMRIVHRILEDIVPKSIVFMMIHQLKDRMQNELLAEIYGDPNVQEMLKESPEELQRRRDLIKVYESTKAALKILGDVNLNTKTTSLPPPVLIDEELIPTTTKPSDSRNSFSFESKDRGSAPKPPKPPVVPAFKPSQPPPQRLPPPMRPTRAAPPPMAPRPSGGVASSQQPPSVPRRPKF